MHFSRYQTWWWLPVAIPAAGQTNKTWQTGTPPFLAEKEKERPEGVNTPVTCVALALFIFWRVALATTFYLHLRAAYRWDVLHDVACLVSFVAPPNLYTSCCVCSAALLFFALPLHACLLAALSPSCVISALFLLPQPGLGQEVRASLCHPSRHLSSGMCGVLATVPLLFLSSSCLYTPALLSHFLQASLHNYKLSALDLPACSSPAHKPAPSALLLMLCHHAFFNMLFWHFLF